MSDTRYAYREAEAAVALADGRKEGRRDREHNMPESDICARRNHVRQDPSDADSVIEVDGWVTYHWPERRPDEPRVAFSFPFKDIEAGEPWHAAPDRPIWKWENPGDPLSNITLSPSLGVRDHTGETVFHCFLKEGETKWL